MAMNAASSGFYSRARLGFAGATLASKAKPEGGPGGGSFWEGKARSSSSHGHGTTAMSVADAATGGQPRGLLHRGEHGCCRARGDRLGARGRVAR